MIFVAGGITTVLQINLTIGSTLSQLGSHIAIILLGIYIADESLFGLEIKSYSVVLISVTTHLEYWCTEFLTERVERTCSMYQTGIELHEDLITLQIHILIFHMGLAIQMG